jgi:hypothetical protein
MHLPLNPSRALHGLTFVATLLLAACGGGGSGSAIKALPQTLQFDPAPVLALGGTAKVVAKASSGLVVSYSSLTPTVCSANTSTGVVTDLAAGTCTLAADQAGNDDYAPANQVTQSLIVLVNPAQILSFGPAPELRLYGSTTVTASASSGLPVTYSSSTPALCTVHANSGVVTSLAAGTCTLVANQPGDANYNAAAPVTQSLTVASVVATATPPGAPTGLVATLGSAPGTIVISFVGPADSGGAAITGYSVVSSPSGLVASGTASPITVPCPATCSGYRLQVQAANRAGQGTPSAGAEVLTRFLVKTTIFEPDTQPQDTIFTGSFMLNSSTQTVSGLAGSLTESMTGPPMVTVPLSYQLSSVSDGQGGLRVSSFALNTTQVFAEGGFAADSEGFYFGWPSARHPGAPGGVGNAFVTIYVNPANPTGALTQAQINQLAYGDCYPGGMMGDTCMTGYWGRGTMGGYPVAQTITRP